mmetsp:Transcript_33895/g.95258  ORF Transcript_33895/g.95258 Transcript_33895/m.95258 type:complete len:315 (+) Transcript_33895:708-1652(+)
MLTHRVEHNPVDTIFMAFKHAEGLALGQAPKVDPGVGGSRRKPDGLALEGRHALARGVEGDAVAAVLVPADRERGLARRHFPQLDKSRPRRGAEQLRVGGELALRQGPLVPNLRNLGHHRFLQEGAKPVDALLVLDRVLLGALAPLLDEPLVGPGNGPLGDLHAGFEELLQALRVEEVLVTCSLLSFGIHCGCSAPGHDCPQAVAPLIGPLAEDAHGLAELAELRLDLGITGGNGQLALTCPLLKSTHRVLVLLPGAQHVLRGMVDQVLVRGQHDVLVVRAPTAVALVHVGSHRALEAAIVDVLLVGVGHADGV